MRPSAAALIAFAAVAAIAVGAAAGAPRASCQARSTGDRVAVDLALDDFLDRELLDLVRMGLSGRLHLDVALLRRRRFWFDERLAERPLDLDVRAVDGGRRLLLDGAPLGDPGHLRSRVVLWPGHRLDGGRHVVEVSAALQVVTPSSLGKVARWMVGDNPAGDRGVLSRLFARAVADDLVRRDGCTCGVGDPGRDAAGAR